jgi:hypothetical protein
MRSGVSDSGGEWFATRARSPIVLPTHWDNFLAPYGASQQANLDALQSFVQEIVAASPKTKVIGPKYFEAILLETTVK